MFKRLINLPRLTISEILLAGAIIALATGHRNLSVGLAIFAGALALSVLAEKAILCE